MSKLTHHSAVAGAQRPVARGLCHNCGAAVSGNFCPACGQETTLHVASAREFLHEFIGHYVALEGKLWKTLALLLFRPGKLTAEYIAGRRARYVQPLRIYLTLSIIFFALLKYGPSELIKADAPAAPTTQSASADDKVHVSTRIGDINPAWEAKILQIGAMPHAQRMALIKTKFFAYVPYAMFCIMPLFALYLKLLYLRSGRTYGEHMLFALHSNAFAFLLLGLIWAIPGGWVDTALFLWLLAYLPVAMRRVYGGGKLATAARWTVLMTVYVITAAAVVVGTVFTATIVL
ncbi:MAG: DUF3667 domain-containing protein [Pseudomonadota bacterium]|nr:DUF3667 domain-containing protein [Pseudomonadota bacterium]